MWQLPLRCSDGGLVVAAWLGCSSRRGLAHCLYQHKHPRTLLLRGQSCPEGEIVKCVAEAALCCVVLVCCGCCCRFNPPGKSPPFCVEYYTGWLTHYGEPMANTSTQLVGD
jgi:hypothetical protein